MYTLATLFSRGQYTLRRFPRLKRTTLISAALYGVLPQDPFQYGVFEFECAANLDRGPTAEQLRAGRANGSNRRIVELPGQLLRRKLSEFVRSPYRPRTALTIEQSDDTFDLYSFVGERSSSPLSRGVFDVPSCSDQAKESVPITKGGFDRLVR